MEIYRKNAGPESWGQHFVHACAAKTHMDMLQEQFHLALTLTVRTPLVATLFGEKKTLTAWMGSSPLQMCQVTLQEGHRLQLARHFSSRPTLVSFVEDVSCDSNVV